MSVSSIAPTTPPQSAAKPAAVVPASQKLTPDGDTVAVAAKEVADIKANAAKASAGGGVNKKV